MSSCTVRTLAVAAFCLTGPFITRAVHAEQDLATARWVKATAYAVPKETATEGEGYFSIIEGHNGRLYIGTHANAVNSWLVEFDPAAEKMKVVVDAHKAIGKDIRGFGAQAKIHTRNNVGASGKIYFGTKQGYPDTAKGEKREDYPGGYPMVYDPKTDETKVYPIPVPHEGINSITPDESRGVAYISTCSDGRPGPGENSHFLILDLKTGKYRNLIDTKHVYGFIVVDYLGRAYHPMLGGGIVRYDPKTDTLEVLKQTFDGKEPTRESNLANVDVQVSVQKQPSPGSSDTIYKAQVIYPTGHPINWDISPDGKLLYSLPMSTNNAYVYDLTQKGDTLAGRSLGTLVPGAKNTDCRAMCVGPTGTMYAAITESHSKVGQLLHLVSYRPGDKAPRDHGPVAVSNPNFTEFVDKSRKPLPFHGGFGKFGDVTTTKYVILGVCEARSGDVYILALHPYSVLKVSAKELGKK
jgi:sugar lactone lactonase YvrE